jgi:hypothetical protein
LIIMLDGLCADAWRLVLILLTPLEVAALRGCARTFEAKWPSHDPIWKLVGPNASLPLLFAHIQSVKSACAFTAIYPDVYYSQKLQWRQSLPAFRYACHRGWLVKAQLIGAQLPARPRYSRRNWITRGSDAPLWRAFRANHTHVVEWLVSTYQLETFRGYIRYRCFEDCCRRGHLELAQFVLRASVVTGRANAVNMGLVAASRYGRLAVVNWLLSLDSLDGVRAYEVATALHDACDYGHLPIVLRLLDTGDLCPTEVEIRKRGAMVAACAGGHLEVARALVDHYYRGQLLDIVFNDPTGFDAIVRCVTKACTAGHFAVAEWLVSSVEIPRDRLLRTLNYSTNRPTIRWLLRRFRITISEVPQAAWITKPWLFKELRFIAF